MADKHAPQSAVYVGSFDPLTHGHVDIIQRGSRIFERVVVGIGINPDKKPLFSPDERLEHLHLVMHRVGIRNVHVECFEGLAVNFVRNQHAAVMLRGIRTLGDYESEFTMTLANRALAPDIETVFLMASEKYTHVSSTLIKQIASMGKGESAKRLVEFVPEEIVPRLLAKLAE